MVNLRPDYTNEATVDANGLAIVPIARGVNEQVWEIQQITVNYGTVGDNPSVQVTKNGQVYSGAAVMLPGNGVNNLGGLAQTFGGYPYLYMEQSDQVQIEVSNGTQGTIVNIHAQYRVLSYNAPELDGYF